MSFKTLFLAVGCDQDAAQIDRAIEIARGLEAHLVVAVVGIAVPPPASPYGVVPTDLWAGELDEGQAVTRDKAAALVARLEASGVSFEVEPQFVDRGMVTSIAARSARYADLTLVQIQAPGAEPLQGLVMNGALFESGRPVLLLPETAVTFPKVERVLIAWDASVEAAKAVREAIGLMQRAKAVDAVLIDPVPSFDGHGAEPGADLATYLGRHGVTVTVHRLPREGQEVGDILRRTATDLGADLIVMGGFGHSRLRERIFGGTTTAMMKNIAVPVLMAH